MPVITSMLYLRQARRRSRSMTSKYSSICSGPMVKLSSLLNLPISRRGSAKMVGDADAVEAAPAVKIHHLRHGQFAVGVIGVNVKIAQQHPRFAGAVGRTARAGRRVMPGWSDSKSSAACFRGPSSSHWLQSQFRDAHGGVGPGNFGQIFAPAPPDPAVVRQRPSPPIPPLRGFSPPPRRRPASSHQPRVAVLLAGDDLVEDHRAARRRWLPAPSPRPPW